jgi:hypothetical protein
MGYMSEARMCCLHLYTNHQQLHEHHSAHLAEVVKAQLQCICSSSEANDCCFQKGIPAHPLTCESEYSWMPPPDLTEK